MHHFIFIDDEDYIREGFSELMDWHEINFVLDGLFSSAAEAMAYMHHCTTRPQVVISDIRMGGMLGTELAWTLREEFPDLLVVLISGYQDFEYALHALHANVFDYLLKPFSQTQIRALFARLTQRLDDVAQKKREDEGKTFDDLTTMAVRYIEANFHTDITLEDVANHVHLNPAYFSRYFKKNTELNFIDYLTRLRMEQAKTLLRQPQLKIYQVCQSVGFKNLQHFYRLFKQYTGYTPAVYQQTMQQETIR